MSTFVWLVKHAAFPSVEALNQAILTKDPAVEGIYGADQIISITWDPNAAMYVVFWKIRQWMQGGEV